MPRGLTLIVHHQKRPSLLICLNKREAKPQEDTKQLVFLTSMFGKVKGVMNRLDDEETIPETSLLSKEAINTKYLRLLSTVLAVRSRVKTS